MSVLSIKIYVYLLHITAYITFIIHNMTSRYIIVRLLACCLLLTHSIGVAQAQKRHRSTRKVQTQPLFHVNDTLPIISEYDTLGRLTFRQDHFNDVFFTKETFIYQFPICIWDPPSYSKDSLTGQDQMEYHETYVKDFLDTPLQGSLDVFFLSENRIITRNDDGQISHIAYQEGKIVYFN